MTKTFEISDHIKALIFDCDGTLADTMPLHFRSYGEALGDNAKWFTEEIFYEQAGVPAEQVMELLRDKFDLKIDAQLVARQKEELFGEYLHQVTAIKPVEQIAHEYHGRLPMAVASGGTTENVVRTLELLGLRGLFGAVVSADDVENGKPAPDMFLEAARRMGVTAGECLVFEDGDKGIEAAVAAGMEWVDVRGW